MKFLFYILFAAGFVTAACTAQSTNTELLTTSWGKPDHNVQISISITNTLIVFGSNFVVTIELKNSSTNIVLVRESVPEADFTIYLLDGSGKTYQLTQSIVFFTRNFVSYLRPGQSRTWGFGLSANKYYEPPGLIPIHKDIPRGDYRLKATGTFRLKNGAVINLESDLKVQIV
jgi:hypothetical protein